MATTWVGAIKWWPDYTIYGKHPLRLKQLTITERRRNYKVNGITATAKFVMLLTSLRLNDKSGLLRDLLNETVVLKNNP